MQKINDKNLIAQSIRHLSILLVLVAHVSCKSKAEEPSHESQKNNKAPKEIISHPATVIFISNDDMQQIILDTINIKVETAKGIFSYVALGRDTFNIPIEKAISAYVTFSSRAYHNRSISMQEFVPNDTVYLHSSMRPIVPSPSYRHRQEEEWRKMWNKKIQNYPNHHDENGTLLIDLTPEELKAYMKRNNIEHIDL